MTEGRLSVGSVKKLTSRLSPSSPRSVGEGTEFGEHGDYLERSSVSRFVVQMRPRRYAPLSGRLLCSE